ncbi:hypothetical protein ANCCEY_15335, partial [Ancylostoma ceylanicum]
VAGMLVAPFLVSSLTLDSPDNGKTVLEIGLGGGSFDMNLHKWKPNNKRWKRTSLCFQVALLAETRIAMNVFNTSAEDGYQCMQMFYKIDYKGTTFTITVSIQRS